MFGGLKEWFSPPARRAFGCIHTPTMKQPPSMCIFPHQQAEKSLQNQNVLSDNPPIWERVVSVSFAWAVVGDRGWRPARKDRSMRRH